ARAVSRPARARPPSGRAYTRTRGVTMTTTVPLVGITAHVSLVDDGDGIEVLHHVTNVAYTKAIRKAGGVPVLLPMGTAADAETCLARVDALLVTGGDDVNPDRYRAE